MGAHGIMRGNPGHSGRAVTIGGAHRRVGRPPRSPAWSSASSSPADSRAAWLAVGLGGCLILAFAIQLWAGRSQGFTQRVAASILGALFVLGIISLGFGLATIVPG